MDNLAMCMIQCKKDGYGSHYGAWRAAQGDVPIFVIEPPEDLPACPRCGERFKPTNVKQIYCGAYCQNRASIERCKKKKEGAEDGQA